MSARVRLVLVLGLVLATGGSAYWFGWQPRALARFDAELLSAGLSPELSDALVARLGGDQQAALWAGAYFGGILLVTCWLGVLRWVGRPLTAVRRYALSLSTREFDISPPKLPTGDFAELARSIGRLGRAYQTAEAELTREASLRKHAEDAARASEERYVLAVRCANDGLWEWDLKTDRVYFAPNWKALVGCIDDEIGDAKEEWVGRVHPDDRETVQAALDAHLRGETSGFECDHRLRSKDGSYRWFLARGRAVRSASGKPLTFIGLITDISSRKRAEEILLGIAHGLTAARGDAFFQNLVRNFAEVLGTRMAFVCQCLDRPATRVRMLAWWNDGKFDDNIEFELVGTPCDGVVNKGEMVFVPRNVGALYPKEVGMESYLGLPIFDRTGTVIGHLACFGTVPMPGDLPTLAIFEIFAVRAGIEIEQRMSPNPRQEMLPGRP